jgi:hypothetical protein
VRHLQTSPAFSCLGSLGDSTCSMSKRTAPLVVPTQVNHSGMANMGSVHPSARRPSYVLSPIHGGRCRFCKSAITADCEPAEIGTTSERTQTWLPMNMKDLTDAATAGCQGCTLVLTAAHRFSLSDVRKIEGCGSWIRFLYGPCGFSVSLTLWENRTYTTPEQRFVACTEGKCRSKA